MQNEILKPVLATDEVAVPRYDVVSANGQVLQQNVELRLKNEVMQQGTPYSAEAVLPNELAKQLGLPTSATPADAFSAVIAKSGAKVSMNAPTAENNIAAGYSIGAMWIRPNYTLHNLAYSKQVADFVVSACVAKKEVQTVTATGNGDDKVISVTLEHGSETGWLYCVVTPSENAVSAKVIAGMEDITLTVGEANVIKHKFSGTGVTFEATYETANSANGSTIVIDKLTVIDEAATLEQVEADFRDVTDTTVYGFASGYAPFDSYKVGSDSWYHIKDGFWRGGLTTYTEDEFLTEFGYDVTNRVMKKITSSGSWTAPADLVGAESIVIAVGGGGGGGGRQGTTVNTGSGGGGGGFVTIKKLKLVPGQKYSVIIGAGGTAGASGANGGKGGTTIFGDNLVVAEGGNGGYCSVNGGHGGDGASGGGAGYSVNNTAANGGNGVQFGGGGGNRKGVGGRGGTFGGGGGGGSDGGAGGEGGQYGGHGGDDGDTTAKSGVKGKTFDDNAYFLYPFYTITNTSSAAGGYTATNSGETGGSGGGGFGGKGGAGGTSYGGHNAGAGGGGYGGNGGNGQATGAGGGGGYGGTGGNGGTGGGGGGGFFANGGNAAANGSAPGGGGGGGYVTHQADSYGEAGAGGKGAVIIIHGKVGANKCLT